jgi:SAM-dependent methyltransferase
VDDLQLIIDLHLDAERQGPGSDSASRTALELAGLDRSRRLRIADIGCGTGSSARFLARELNAHVSAVDFLPAFIRKLAQRVDDAGLSESIAPVVASMASLPFPDATFDAIWSEGAVYNMGLEAGVSQWRRMLKPGGLLCVSELTWLTAERPPELQAFWSEAYPEVDTASAKSAVLERHGYSPIGYFVLPEDCWIENYYEPMRARFDAFVKRNDGERAQAIVEQEQREIALYEKYRAYYGYGFYIAKRME